MTKINTSTNLITRDELFKAAKEAGKVYASALMKQDKVTAKVLYNAKETLDGYVSDYNAITIKETYDELLAADNPIVALCKRFAWGKLYTFIQTDKSNKSLSVRFNSRRTRFNLLDFLDYADKSEYVLANAAAIRNSLVHSARTLADYIKGCVTNDKTMPISEAKSALEQLVTAIGLEGVHARSVDVRFITFAVSKARDLGELAVVTDASVAPYIMDMFHVQINKRDYKFEEKKKGEAKSEELLENELPTLEDILNDKIEELEFLV